MNKHYKRLILSLCFFLLLGCSKIGGNPEHFNVDSILTENQLTCNLLLEVITLEENKDMLLICDESKKIRLHYFNNIKNQWVLQKSGVISKDPNKVFDWSFNVFKDQLLTVKYQMVWGIVWEDKVKRIIIKDNDRTYQAVIKDSNQNYKLWYYVFDKDITDTPTIHSFAGYDEQDNMIVSFP